MSLQWIEGFEINRTLAAITARYTGAGTALAADAQVVGGRLHGRALAGGSGSVLRTPTFAGQGTWCVGLGLRVKPGAGTFKLLRWFSGATETLRLELVVSADTHLLRLVRDATVLATSAAISNDSVWRYVECKVVIHVANGTYELRIDEEVAFQGNNANTDHAAGSGADKIEFQFASQELDDIYILDGQLADGLTNFFGTVVVEGLQPVKAGDLIQWTPFPAGSKNAEDVDDSDEGDADVTYVTVAANNRHDFYRYEQLSFVRSGAEIVAVVVETEGKTDAAGNRTIRPSYRTGTPAVNYPGANVVLDAAGYKKSRELWPFRPAPLGDAWTVGLVNAGQFGFESVV